MIFEEGGYKYFKKGDKGKGAEAEKIRKEGKFT